MVATKPYSAQRGPVVAIGEVGVVEAHLLDQLELVAHRGEGSDEGDAADDHGGSPGLRLGGWRNLLPLAAARQPRNSHR